LRVRPRRRRCRRHRRPLVARRILCNSPSVKSPPASQQARRSPAVSVSSLGKRCT
jgi:hypothetical protein